MTEIVLAPGAANERVIGEDEILGQLNPAKTHTGMGDFRASIVPDSTVDAYAQRQDRVNIKVDNTVVWTGYLTQSDRNKRGATQTIGGPGIAKKLEETRPDYETLGGSLSYSSIALEDALRDYWGQTPFSNYTVYDQTTESVATNEQIQSADTTTEWQTITSLVDTDPFVIQNGKLQLVQTCFTTEAESATLSGSPTIFDADRFSGNSPTSGNGQAVEFDANGQSLEFTFTLDHKIPDGSFEYSIYFDGDSSSGSIGTVNYYLDNTNLGSFSGATTGGDGVFWRNLIGQGSISDPGSVSAGSHTIRIETGSGWGGGLFYVDVVAPHDTRFSYTFDSSVSDGTDGGTYLSGPELYPQSASIELNEQAVSYNITGATVNSTWNDTSTNQAIAVSNDGGSTYLSASNTSSTTQTFADAGRTAQTKFTYSRYGNRDNGTPTTGFNGQTVDSYTLTVDGNDLVVIDELELSRDHFSNLQTLHNYGDFVWSIDHTGDSISNISVYSFQRGDRSRTSPSVFNNPIDEQSGIKANRYYNVIYVQGARNSGGGGPNGRPVAEVKADSSVINNDGREITGFVRDQSITTEAGALFRARALLSAAQSNDDLVGGKDIPPVNMGDVLPGFSYSVDFGQGASEKVLETVNLSYGDSITSTAQFALEEQIADEINDLKSQSRTLGNQV